MATLIKNVVMAGVSCCSLLALADGDADKLERAWSTYCESRLGAISIDGDVTDGDDKPLADVMVTTELLAIGNRGTEAVNAKSKELISGRFQYQIEHAISIVMTFSKDNYLPETRFFSFLVHGKGAVYNPEYDSRAIAYPGVKIRMQKRDKATVVGALVSDPLCRRDVELELTAEENATVWDISREFGLVQGEPVLKNVLFDLRELEQPWEQFRGLAPGTVLAVFLPFRPDLGLPPAPAVLDGKEVLCPEDKYICLGILDGVGGGFLLVPSPGGPAAAAAALAAMKEAPANGYQGVLMLERETLAAWIKSGKPPLNFYFRLNGLYGKGCIRSITNDGKEGLRVKAEFFLQPNGSRKLESME